MGIKLFTDEAFETYLKLSKYFEKVKFIPEDVHCEDDYLGLPTEFQHTLARTAFMFTGQLIQKEEVVNGLFWILKRCLACYFGIINEEKEVEYHLATLFEGYATNILCQTCFVTQDQVDVLMRCVRHYVSQKRTRYEVPLELTGVIEKTIPLTGNDKSPLSEEELRAIQRLIGSKKSSHVHILLGSLYELGRDQVFFDQRVLTEGDFVKILTSPWMFLVTNYCAS